MKITGKQICAEFYLCRSDLLDDVEGLERMLERGMELCGFHLVRFDAHKFNPIGVTLIAIISESHVAIHTYPEAHHASIDIFHCSADSAPLLRLLRYMEETLAPKSVKKMEIQRGETLQVVRENCIISPATYGVEVRYYFGTKLFEKHSDYQQIEIVENGTFGRMLFLDGDLQIAESDTGIYDRAMVQPLVAAGKLENVVILGGGDGGVLNRVLSQDPGRVTLVDIDGEVIEASKRYLPSICGTAFDDPRAEIRVEDANRFLDRPGNFDAVIYDLTMHPEAFTILDKAEFLRNLFTKIRKNLRPDGIISLQCCSALDTHFFDLTKEILEEFFTDVAFEKIYVPSYCEPWIFGSARNRR